MHESIDAIRADDDRSRDRCTLGKYDRSCSQFGHAKRACSMPIPSGTSDANSCELERLLSSGGLNALRWKLKFARLPSHGGFVAHHFVPKAVTATHVAKLRNHIGRRCGGRSVLALTRKWAKNEPHLRGMTCKEVVSTS